MKVKELRDLSDAELQGKLTENHEELFNLRFQQATRQLKNTARFGQVRNEIAKIQTILRERQLAIR